MKSHTRRSFLKKAFVNTSLAMGAVSGSVVPSEGKQVNSSATRSQGSKPKIKFSVIGLNHGHIYGQTDTIVRAGGELCSFTAKEPELISAFAKRYPQAKFVKSEAEILEDSAIQLIVSASISDERGPLGIKVMQHEKDFMSDKPGFVSLSQLEEARKVQRETKRIYSIMYSERFGNRATVKAGELVQQGTIGKVIQTIGLGPHRLSSSTRPPWFFDKKRFGGILCDIGSHQFDQFLFFTGSTEAEIVASQWSNVNHPEYPDFEDFGDVMLRGNKGTGYIRVDWFTPDGLTTWGDGRLTLLGSDGYIELRKYTDPAGREGGDHLFLVNREKPQYIDCKLQPLPYGEQLVNDILNRTETAMSQQHCFLVMELALKAQAQAKKVVLSK